MSNSSKIDTSTSLNDAFKLITKIFEEERTYYENTINSLKDKISELEDSLLLEKKENMAYQERISKLKAKIFSISKTVSKLEESDLEVKFDNSNDIPENVLNNNTYLNNGNYNTLIYRNTSNINSFRKQSKILSDNNRKSINMNSNTYNQYLKKKLFDNNKVNNNPEDISRCYKKKTHKKTLSTKIKNNILNIENIPKLLKRKNENNNKYKSKYYKDEDSIFFELNNLNENDSKKWTLPVDNDIKLRENRKKNLGKDKFVKIEQKIKGLKSALIINNNRENNKNWSESFPNSFNILKNISQ